MWRLILGTMGVKSLVQGLNAAATAGFEPRTVWSEVRCRNRLATALLSALSQFPCLLFVQIRPFLDSIHICPERIQAKSVCFLEMESLDWLGPIAVSEYSLFLFWQGKFGGRNIHHLPPLSAEHRLCLASVATTGDRDAGQTSRHFEMDEKYALPKNVGLCTSVLFLRSLSLSHWLQRVLGRVTTSRLLTPYPFLSVNWGCILTPYPFLSVNWGCILTPYPFLSVNWGCILTPYPFLSVNWGVS